MEVYMDSMVNQGKEERRSVSELLTEHKSLFFLPAPDLQRSQSISPKCA